MGAFRACFFVRAFLADDTFWFVIAVDYISVHGHKVSFHLLVTLFWSRNRAVFAVWYEAFAIKTFVSIDVQPVVLDTFFAIVRISIAFFTLFYRTGQIFACAILIEKIVALSTRIAAIDSRYGAISA